MMEKSEDTDTIVWKILAVNLYMIVAKKIVVESTFVWYQKEKKMIDYGYKNEAILKNECYSIVIKWQLLFIFLSKKTKYSG